MSRTFTNPLTHVMVQSIARSMIGSDIESKLHHEIDADGVTSGIDLCRPLLGLRLVGPTQPTAGALGY
jgi:hypothetical protein